MREIHGSSRIHTRIESLISSEAVADVGWIAELNKEARNLS